MILKTRRSGVGPIEVGARVDAIKWYQSIKRFFSFCSREGEFTMPPRRMDRQSPNLEEEREMPRGRGREA
jgi:hypothetical protein